VASALGVMPAVPRKVASEWRLRQVYGSIFLSITTSCAALQAEPLLIRDLCGGDIVRSALLLSSTSTISGLISIFVNQVGGRLSDTIGRKLLFLVGPAFSLIQGVLIFLNSASANPSLSLLLVLRTLRMCFGTFSSSVMSTASLSDLAEGKQLAVANSRLWACAGLGVIVGPLAEGTLLSRGLHSRYSYLLAAAVSAIQMFYQMTVVTESLPQTERKPFTVAGINPLGFLNLFSAKTPRTLKKLVMVASLQSFLEGKNVVDIVQIWQREHLRWDVLKMRDFTATYGVCVFIAGQLLTPASENSLL
jgi:MFS family permease